jgi:hypothetical protein
VSDTTTGERPITRARTTKEPIPRRSADVANAAQPNPIATARTDGSEAANVRLESGTPGVSSEARVG